MIPWGLVDALFQFGEILWNQGGVETPIMACVMFIGGVCGAFLLSLPGQSGHKRFANLATVCVLRRPLSETLPERARKRIGLTYGFSTGEGGAARDLDGADAMINERERRITELERIAW